MPDAYQLRWEPLMVMAGEEEVLFARAFTSEVNAENVFEFLAFRHDNPSSIVQCIAKARENARTIRDCISREMWEDINGLYRMVSRFNPTTRSWPDRIAFATKSNSARIVFTASPTPPWSTTRAGDSFASAGRWSARR